MTAWWYADQKFKTKQTKKMTCQKVIQSGIRTLVDKCKSVSKTNQNVVMNVKGIKKLF